MPVQRFSHQKSLYKVYLKKQYLMLKFAHFIKH